jgi:succinyl-diaminopimelate desuccinylase
MLDWLTAQGEVPDHALVGEPTATARAGDAIKIGRRGSLHVRLTARGVQGHTAYPGRVCNPIPVLARLVAALDAAPLDTGTAHFEPSTLVFSTFDVGNPAGNVSPGEARAACNIRFNDLHSPGSLRARVEAAAEAAARGTGCAITVETLPGADAFLTRPGPYTDFLCAAVSRVTGTMPQLSTEGGTSDARFVKDVCPVAELGLAGATMHKTDECAPLADIERLVDIYAGVLESYFAKPPL